MLVIGLVGGVASGKSLVATQFQQLGACVLDADLVGHEVLREQKVKQRVRQHWGAAVFDAHGEINRAALAAIVFGLPPAGPEQLAILEQITHPEIHDRLRARIAEQRAGADVPALVLDAAVMFKTGWYKMCDQIVFVDTPRDVRIRRAAQRGWDRSMFESREAAQTSIQTKKQRATAMVDNSQDGEQTYQQVQRLWKQWTAA